MRAVICGSVQLHPVRTWHQDGCDSPARATAAARVGWLDSH